MRWPYEDPRNWRPFFTLLPRVICGSWVWLETVESRSIYHRYGSYRDFRFREQAHVWPHLRLCARLVHRHMP